MANQIIFRVIPKTLTSISTTTPSSSAISFLRHLRPLAAAVKSRHILLPSFRALSTRATTSSLNDPNPNWSNRPPKETILLDGCDFEHWLVVMEKPDSDPTRDEIIDSYIKTFAEVIGSEEEARRNIYSVSTRHYFAFGALCSEELSYKLKELPKVRWVLPDSYLNVKEKDYGGEPFINGQAVPYDPKYHEEWVRNNIRANERNQKSGRNSGVRPRNRNSDMQTRRTMTNRGPNMVGPPPNNAGGYPPNNAGGYAPAPPSNQGGYAPNNTAGGYPPPPNNAGGYAPARPSNQDGYAPPSNQGGYAPPNQGGYAPPNAGGYAPNNTGGGYPPHNMGGPPPPNMGRPSPPNSGYGVPQNNYPGNMGQVPQNQNMGGFPPNAGWANNQ